MYKYLLSLVLLLFVGCKSSNKASESNESFAKEDKVLGSDEFLIADYSDFTRTHTILGVRANFISDKEYMVDLCQDSQCKPLGKSSFSLVSPNVKSSELAVVLKKCVGGVCSEYKRYKYPAREVLSAEKLKELNSINSNISTRYSLACYYEKSDSLTEVEARGELDYLIKKSEQIENSNPLLYQLIFHDRLMHSIALRSSMISGASEEEGLSLTREARETLPQVKWYPQTHYRADSYYNDEAFRSQYDIYVDLQKSARKLPPKKKIVLFDEGRLIDDPSKQVSIFHKSEVDQMIDKMSKPGFKQHQLSMREKALFVKYGAGYFIEAKYPEKIAIKGTERIDEWLVTGSAFAKSMRNQDNDLLRRVVIEVHDLLTSAYLLYKGIDPWKIEPNYFYSIGILERELITLEEMSKYKKKHPDDDVRLLYGGGHSFDEWKNFPLSIDRFKQMRSLEMSFKQTVSYKAEHGKIPVAHQWAYDTKVTNDYDQLNKIRQTQTSFNRRIKFKMAESQSELCEGIDEKILESVKIIFQ